MTQSLSHTLCNPTAHTWHSHYHMHYAIQHNTVIITCTMQSNTTQSLSHALYNLTQHSHYHTHYAIQHNTHMTQSLSHALCNAKYMTQSLLQALCNQTQHTHDTVIITCTMQSNTKHIWHNITHISAVNTPLQWIFKNTQFVFFKSKLVTHVESHASTVRLLNSGE